MTEEHKAHAAQLADTFERLMVQKYAKGAEEYGTKLWQDYTPSQLLDNAIEEAIDQVVYLLTLRDLMA